MRRSHLATPALLASFVALALPAPSQASLPATDTIVCTFSGRTYNMDDIPGILDSESQSLGDAWDDALALLPGNQANETGVIVETGSYTLDTANYLFMGIPDQCLHIDVDGALSLDSTGDNTGARAARVTFTSGAYDSVLCGTGTTSGLAIVDIVGDGEIASLRAPYTFFLVAGEGLAYSPSATVAPTSGSGVPTRDALGTGAVHFEAIGQASTGTTACVETDAADFEVAGTIAWEATS